MQACVRVQAFDTMLEAFQRNHELGLGELSLRLYSSSLVELIKAEQLDLATRWAAVLPCQCLCMVVMHDVLRFIGCLLLPHVLQGI